MQRREDPKQTFNTRHARAVNSGFGDNGNRASFVCSLVCVFSFLRPPKYARSAGLFRSSERSALAATRGHVMAHVMLARRTKVGSNERKLSPQSRKKCFRSHCFERCGICFITLRRLVQNVLISRVNRISQSLTVGRNCQGGRPLLSIRTWTTADKAIVQSDCSDQGEHICGNRKMNACAKNKQVMNLLKPFISCRRTNSA